MSQRRMTDAPKVGCLRGRVGWVMIRCPLQYNDLMRAGQGHLGFGHAAMAGERRRIGPVIRELERTVDPLFGRVGINLDLGK